MIMFPSRNIKMNTTEKVCEKNRIKTFVVRFPLSFYYYFY